MFLASTRFLFLGIHSIIHSFWPYPEFMRFIPSHSCHILTCFAFLCLATCMYSAQTVAESDLVRSVEDACGEGRGTPDNNDEDVDIECGEQGSEASGAKVGLPTITLGGDDEAACVRLPPSPPAPNGSRLVPNCCAVCLCPYEVGETLVWSSNTSCRHAFHRDCVVDYLCKVQEVDCPCPCCRGTFVTLSHHLDGKNGKNRKRLSVSDAATRTSSFDADET